MAQQLLPHENVSLKTMKGERWKDIPGFEGYYLISNYGRVKRLEYELKYRNGGAHVHPQKIIRPIVKAAHNRFVNDTSYYLYTVFTLFGAAHRSSVARLIYHCFVEPFDLQDKGVVILAKDRNTLNLRPSNLRKATISEKQQRISDLGRKGKVGISEKTRGRMIRALIENSRTVSKYDWSGKQVKTYPSVKKAAQKTGLSTSHIYHSIHGRECTAGGFIWQYGDAGRIDIKLIQAKYVKQKKRNKALLGKPVTKYSMDGERLAVYPTVNEAAKNEGIQRSSIARVALHKRNSAGGFVWRRGQGPAKIDLSNHNERSTQIEKETTINPHRKR